jgi:hypothetical protein
MARIVFIVSLLAFSSVAAANHASAQTRQECDNRASSCLGGCASIFKPPPDDGPYNQCVVRCNSERNSCRVNSPELPRR